MPSWLSVTWALYPNSTGLPSRPLAIGRASGSCRLTRRVAPSGIVPASRLSRWMIAASIRHARERYPLLDGLRRDIADNNQYMRRVNDSLGYLPTHTTYEY
jgi:hypothetical protein